MATESNQNQRQPVAKVEKYKVVYIGKDTNELKGKMFATLPDAISYANLVEGGLIFEANPSSDPKTGSYSWTIMKESPAYSSFKVGAFIYQYRKIIAIIIVVLILVFIYYRYKHKLADFFADGGSVSTDIQPQAPLPPAAPAPMVDSTPQPIAQ